MTVPHPISLCESWAAPASYCSLLFFVVSAFTHSSDSVSDAAGGITTASNATAGNAYAGASDDGNCAGTNTDNKTTL